MRHARTIAAIAAGLFCALIVPAKAMAFTECTSKVGRIWVGDGGMVWLALESGGPTAAIAANDPNREGALAAATSAMMAGRTITVRFNADNVSCSASAARFDFVGLYLNSN